MDTTETLKVSGLSKTGQGATLSEMFGVVEDYIKVKIFPKSKKVSDKVKETFLFPINRIRGKSGNEFTEDSVLNFFPPNMKKKAFFGAYLDALNMYNKNPDRLYIDKKGNLYEWDGSSNVISKFIFDKKGFREENEDMPNVKGVIELRLEPAKEKIGKQKRALERDIKRSFDGPILSDRDYTIEDEDPEWAEHIERWLEDKEYREFSKKNTVAAYEEASNRINYDNWKYNLGSKAFTEYDLQDIENQIKLLDALSDKDIRKICRATINKFMRGQDVTVDDVYKDIIKLVGGGPLSWDDTMEKIYEAWDRKNLSSKYAERAALLPGAAPTNTQIIKERAQKLANYSTLAGAFKLVEKVSDFVNVPVLPSVTGFLNTASGYIGGGAGLYGSLFIGGGTALMFVALTIYKRIFGLLPNRNNGTTLSLTAGEVENIVTQATRKAIQDFHQQLLEAARRQQNEVNANITIANQNLENALANRNPSEPVEPVQAFVSAVYTPEFFNAMAAQSNVNLLNRIGDNLMIEAGAQNNENINSNEMTQNKFTSKNAMNNEKDGQSISFGYEKDKVLLIYGKKNGKKEQLMAYRTIPRSAVEEAKKTFQTPARLKGFGVKTMLSQALRNKDPKKWEKVNAARIAYIESVIGRPVELQEPGKPLVFDFDVNVDEENTNLPLTENISTKILNNLPNAKTVSAFTADVVNKIADHVKPAPPPPAPPYVPFKRKRPSHVKIEAIDENGEVVPQQTVKVLNGSTVKKLGEHIKFLKDTSYFLFYCFSGLSTWNNY